MTEDGSRWKRIEDIPGEYRIGHTNGSVCYLIDEQGRVRSEEYHEIHVERPDAGPDGYIRYIGKSGASESQISPINQRYLMGGSE